MNKWAATSLVILIAILCAAHGKATDPPTAVNQQTSKPYAPEDNPDIKRKYTVGRVYWDDVNKVCRRKVNETAPESKMDEILTNQTIVVDPETVKEVFPKAEICNDTLFNDWSYCAKVMFYGEEGVIEARKYFGKDKAPGKEFANMTEFDNYGFMQDMVLLLIDGCIECKNATEEMEVTLSITQKLKAGKILSLCGEEKMHEFGKTTVTLEKGTANFVFGVVLRERLCPHNKVPDKVPNNINDLVIQNLTYKYENVSLMVTHSCRGEETNVSMMLPTIYVFNLTGMDRVLQLRDLELNLTTLNVGATLNQSAVRMKDPTSGIYYIVSVVPGPEPVTTMATGKTSKPTKMPSTKMPPTKMPPTEMPKPTVTDKNMTTMAPTDKTPKRTKMPKSP
uniref:Uncharacterized protein n=1 Tax=Globodera rostochiensis TaxID=31243 RepID=A0A914HVC8_GLORO